MPSKMLTPRKDHPTLSIPTTLKRLGRCWPIALINAHTRPSDILLLLLLLLLVVVVWVVYLGLSNNHSSHRRSRGAGVAPLVVMMLMMIRGRSFRGWIEVHVREKNEKEPRHTYKQTYLINQSGTYMRGFNSIPLDQMR